MNELEIALAAAWIARLGQRRVGELAVGLDCGPTVAERAMAIASTINPDGLAEVLAHGLRHHFHQTVYIRRGDAGNVNAQCLLALEPGGGPDVKVLRVIEDGPGRARALLLVSRQIEFLPPDEAAFTTDIDYPAMVVANGDRLTVHVLTVQNSPSAWCDILGRPVRRAITYVGSDKVHEQIMDHLRDAVELDPGQHEDVSQAVIAMLADPGVDTFDGAYEVGVEGETEHRTTGSIEGRRALREAMSAKFEELIEADRITLADIGFNDVVAGMAIGSRVSIHPVIGKIAIRSLLNGGDLFAFVDALA